MITNSLPAEHWAEAVFRIGEEEIVLEVSVETEYGRRMGL